MKNNIYIGNRYVPVFANPVEWDNLREYEPLTIVTYQGTAYTSRKTVPVGTPLSNTDYWVVTGNYNAQVEQYRQEVASYKEEVDGYVDTLNGAVDDIANVQGRLSTAETDIDNIEAVLSNPHIPVNMKNVIFIGDSYAVPNEDWSYHCRSYLGLASSKCYKSALGSTGFAHKNGDVDFKALLTQAYNNVSVDFRNEVSHIIVCGGANDILNTQVEVGSAIVSFCQQAYAYFPNARVYIGFIGNVRNATKKIEVEQICSTYAHDGQNASYTYLKGVEYILHNYSLLSGDDVHPNAQGYLKLGQGIAEALLTGSVNVVYPRRSCGSVGSDDRLIYEMLDNNIVRINTNNQILLHYSEAFVLTNNTPKDIAVLSPNFWFGNYYQELSCPVSAKVKTTSNTWASLTGEIVVYQNKLQFVPSIITESGGQSYVNLTDLHISRFGMTIPTLLC